MVYPQSSSRVRLEVDAEGNGINNVVKVYEWSALTGEPVSNNPPLIGLIIFNPSVPMVNSNISVNLDAASDPDGDETIAAPISPLRDAWNYPWNGVFFNGDGHFGHGAPNMNIPSPSERMAG